MTPGRCADLAVFDTNLVEAGKNDPARLLRAKVLYTVAGGRVVFDRSQATGLSSAIQK